MVSLWRSPPGIRALLGADLQPMELVWALDRFRTHKRFHLSLGNTSHKKNRVPLEFLVVYTSWTEETISTCSRIAFCGLVYHDLPILPYPYLPYLWYFATLFLLPPNIGHYWIIVKYSLLHKNNHFLIHCGREAVWPSKAVTVTLNSLWNWLQLLLSCIREIERERGWGWFQTFCSSSSSPFSTPPPPLPPQPCHHPFLLRLHPSQLCPQTNLANTQDRNSKSRKRRQ